MRRANDFIVVLLYNTLDNNNLKKRSENNHCVFIFQIPHIQIITQRTTINSYIIILNMALFALLLLVLFIFPKLKVRLSRKCLPITFL